jgi:hypothetical protein
MTAFLAIFAQYLPMLIQLGGAGIDYVLKIRAAAQQTGEWTPELESAFTTALFTSFNLPQFLTDAERAKLTPSTVTVTTVTTKPA